MAYGCKEVELQFIEIWKKYDWFLTKNQNLLKLLA